MDIVWLMLIAAGLFGLALALASLWSVFQAWRKASSRGLTVSFLEALSLTKFFELKDEFLDSCVEFKKTDPDISVIDIVRHHMADGNTETLLENWKKLKSADTDITLKSLVLYDLAGKDMNDLIVNLNRVYELIINDIEEQGLVANYFCRFKIAQDSSGWITPDLDGFKQTIREKIDIALLAGDASDFEALADFIVEKYLDEDFWGQLCHGEVIEQHIRIARA